MSLTLTRTLKYIDGPHVTNEEAEVSTSVVAKSCPALATPMDLALCPWLLCPWDFSRQEYWSELPFLSLGKNS